MQQEQPRQEQRTPSLTQPEELLKVRQLEALITLIEQGSIEEARAYDKRCNIGYFNRCKHWLDKFITCHPQMLELKLMVEKLTTINDSVLIQGETGTGKELLARALHGERKGQFIEINCAGLPEYLIESELFGHTKGAFTGADKETVGLVELSADGTLFLDEIGELPLGVQAKLLRVLADKRIRKVGGKDFLGPINFRLVCATIQSYIRRWQILGKI